MVDIRKETKPSLCNWWSHGGGTENSDIKSSKQLWKFYHFIIMNCESSGHLSKEEDKKILLIVNSNCSLFYIFESFFPGYLASFAFSADFYLGLSLQHVRPLSMFGWFLVQDILFLSNFILDVFLNLHLMVLGSLLGYQINSWMLSEHTLFWNDEFWASILQR